MPQREGARSMVQIFPWTFNTVSAGGLFVFNNQTVDLACRGSDCIDDAMLVFICFTCSGADKVTAAQADWPVLMLASDTGKEFWVKCIFFFFLNIQKKNVSQGPRNISLKL